MYSDTPGSQTASGKLLEAGCGPCSATSNKIKRELFNKTTNTHTNMYTRKSNDFPSQFCRYPIAQVWREKNQIESNQPKSIPNCEQSGKTELNGF